jgi:exopolyphosphatase/pppGpp-phosphohydrolase
MPLETLFQKYGIERSHADNVAKNALELFDTLGAVHGLDPELRNFVEIAALVHDVGVATDFENHHKAGRDILLIHPPSEISEWLFPVVPWIAFLHKKKAGREKVEKLKGKAFGKMPENLQNLTLKVAALIRLADALDYSRMGSRLGKVTSGKEGIRFEIEGHGAAIDAERMSEKSDLWHLLYNTKLEFRPGLKKQ